MCFILPSVFVTWWPVVTLHFCISEFQGEQRKTSTPCRIFVMEIPCRLAHKSPYHAAWSVRNGPTFDGPRGGGAQNLHTVSDTHILTIFVALPRQKKRPAGVKCGGERICTQKQIIEGMGTNTATPPPPLLKLPPPRGSNSC